MRGAWVVAQLNLPCPAGIRAIHTLEAGAFPFYTTACGVMAWYRTRKVPGIPAVARAAGATSTLWMAVLIILDAERVGLYYCNGHVKYNGLHLHLRCGLV